MADWKGNTCDRAVFLNARVYVMAQCKGDAGTFVARGSNDCCSVLQNCEPHDWNCRIHEGLRRNHLSLSSRYRHKACLSPAFGRNDNEE